MITIIAASDNHGDLDSIKTILYKNNADYYFHAGDGCCDPKLLHPFTTVKGNNDYYDLPDYKVIEINDKNRVLLVHGHQYIFNKQKLVEEAKENRCNIVIKGHTHVFTDEYIDGIRIINPGSCFYTRDHSAPSYAKVIINDNNEITVERVNLQSIFY